MAKAKDKHSAHRITRVMVAPVVGIPPNTPTPPAPPAGDQPPASGS
jgi:hypothetical protein